MRKFETARNGGTAVTLALSAAAMPLAATAQPASEDQFPAVLEEVVVTAQKREERVLDVPISITAMTGSEIAERGISNLLEAQYAVSSLTLTEFGPGRQRAQLRGVGTAGGSTGLATVGFYLDEIPLNAGQGGAGPDIRLIDMQRIEVLRGPQPTLYGEGSMGGTIRYITADPDLTAFSGSVGARWGAVTDGGDSWRGNVVLNVPIIEDELGVRVVLAEEQIGGWIDVPGEGRTDANEADISTFRAKVLWQPNDQFSLSLLALTQDLDQDYQNFGDPGSRTTITGFPTFNADDYDLFNAVASYDFGAMTLTGSIGYLDRESNSIFDLTSFGVPFFSAPPPSGFGLPAGLIDSVGLTSDGTTEMWSYEIRLASNGGGPLNWTVGYYQRNPEFTTSSVTLTAPTDVVGLLGFDPFGTVGASESDAYAVFGDVSYAFNEEWEVLLGVRYFDDERTQDTTAGGMPRRADFDTTNPRLNVAWTPTESSTYYFNAAKGFRSGGFNPQIPGFDIPPDFGPEEIWTYEVGTKQAALDGRLSWEFSAYYNEWEDIQAPAPAAAIPFFTNAGAASGPGVDLSMTAILSDAWRLSATYGWTDMEYDENSGDRQAGDSLDLVADNTFSLALDYSRMMANFELRGRADYQHTSGFSLTLRSPPFNQVNDSDSRDVLNLRLGADWGDWEAWLFADNVTDDDGTIYPIIGTNVEPVLTLPRTVGMEFRVSF